MKVTNVEKKEKSTVELTIQVPADEFESAVQKVYLKNRGQIAIPGFRKGKAPRKIIESMYGSGVFYEDAINALYPGAYADAVKEQGLDDVGYPKVEIVEVGKDGLTFKALVSVRPEVKLGQYKGLTAPMDVTEVTEEDVENELKPFINRATRLVSVEREIKEGDTAVIDFEGLNNGVPFEGGTGENYSLEIGSGSFVPGFEEQLVGMRPGQEKDIDITFPEDYVADLAGKAVVFKVKINEVKGAEAPEIDDEFAKDVSEFETLDEFKKDLEEKLAQRYKVNAEQAHEDAIFEQLVEHMECEIPDGMIEVQLDKIMDNYAARLSSQGISVDDYAQMMGMNTATLRASARPAALKQVQMELALEAVSKAENLEAGEAEVKAEIARLAEEYKMEPAQIEAAIPEADLKRDLVYKKASDLVKAEAKVGPAPEKTAKAEEAPEAPSEKPKRTRKKKVEAEEPVEE